MGKTRGSSSKRPHVEEAHQEEEEDLSKTYKAKFLILTHEEGAKFTTIKFWMWKVVFFLGLIIPFQIYTHLFILFSYLFTNLHDLSLSNLHLITYNLHPYYIYKYTLLTTLFSIYSLLTIPNELTHTLFHHFLFYHLLYSLFLIHLDFSSLL